MGLTLTTPVAQANITVYDWTSLLVDAVAGTITVGFTVQDANGNTVRSGSINLPAATAAARIATLKPIIYGDLETLEGVAGTVS